MKNLKYLAILSFVLLTTVSCNIEDPIESTITQYADFEVTGGTYVYVQQGETYQEPGVKALAGEDELEVSVDNTVDTSTPGVYVLNYSATNSDGFAASTTRYVAVGDKVVAEGRDLSGTYLTGTRTNTITQIQPGIYLNSDTLPNNAISVFMVDLGNGSLIIPPQSSRFGVVYADPTLNPDSSVTLNADNSIVINQFISGNGIFSRTFVKQ